MFNYFTSKLGRLLQETASLYRGLQTENFDCAELRFALAYLESACNKCRIEARERNELQAQKKDSELKKKRGY